VVTSLPPGGTAEALGLKKDDVLLTYRGERVRSVAWLRMPRKETGPGEIAVQRGQKRFKVRAEAGALEAGLLDVAEVVALPKREAARRRGNCPAPTCRAAGLLLG
jgi:hypothetical protein